MLHSLYCRLSRGNPWLKARAFSLGYETLSRVFFRQRPVHFLNYGFESADSLKPRLLAEDEPDRASIQLYHHLASQGPVAHARVLEIGCGRGGGASYLARYFQPREVIGMDISPSAVRYCRSSHGAEGLSFLVGDAESVPFPAASFDVVLNVESSHCYGSMSRFLAEVRRILRPGGHFLFCDVRPAADVEALCQAMADSRLEIVSRGDITPQVLRALERESDTRKEQIRRVFPRWLHASVFDFSGVAPGTVFESFSAGTRRYLSFMLRAPVGSEAAP
ncbi:MAG: methyltransferase domain-containing protein [Candidatus Sericytochromatia bacterium]|nr:methyltransferase domain-containing protein [Candidatus Tanganyikabacteria bacterium]